MDNQTSSVLVVYNNPTLMVEVAPNASIQEPTTGGNPIEGHVSHDSPLGHPAPDVVSAPSIGVITHVSEVAFNSSTQEPLTCGQTQANNPVTTSDLEHKSINDGMDYDHDNALEVYHADKTIPSDIHS